MRHVKCALFLAAVPLFVSPAIAQQQNPQTPRHEFRAELRGATEVPLTLSGASATLQLTISDDDSSVHFVLQYQGVVAPVTASHIHIGQPNVNGGVTVFFCGGGGRPDCPPEAATIEGDFTAADVIGLPAQTLDPNDLAAVLSAIRAGETYANLHTMTSPGGEIRGQIRAVRRGGND
jgi:hypothetical protein